MKAEEVRTKTLDELEGQLGDLKKEQFNLRFQKATGQLENVARVRQVRRDIARVIEDVRNGLVSIEGARRDYGVVFADPATFKVDHAETERLRAA